MCPKNAYRTVNSVDFDKNCSTKDSLSGSALSGLKLFITMAFS